MEPTFYVKEVSKADDTTLVFGQVKNGILKAGMKLNINGKVIEAKHVEIRQEEVLQANIGDSCTVIFGGEHYGLLKSCLKQIITFSDEKNPPQNTFTTQPPTPNINPLKFFKNFFARKKE
ncbi:hypothetical protein HY643_00415 [Candidatus Woesearchaeota archaeon]|nr:hypothetical protein [Candidatus Woesearchaeota archaeon]